MAIALALFAYPLFLMWRRKKGRAKAI
jgi:hypothetical protein